MDFANLTDLEQVKGVMRRRDKWIVDLCSDHLYRVGSDGNLHRVLGPDGKQVCMSKGRVPGTLWCLEPYCSNEWTQARLEGMFGC